MFQRISKVVSLLLCALIALPAVAGERHRHHRGTIHWASSAKWANIAKPWFGDRRHHHGHNRHVRLKHFSPSSNGYGIRSVIAASPQLSRHAYSGVYGGTYGYETEGGTYFGVDGYETYSVPQAAPLAAKAKVIDVAVQGDPCSYEASVCVIRP
ncbi:hypothetical protein N2599_16660 [Rhizobium sullae]|uniref:Uncharacterized protein n=1 Tax=Rhizobium sullae TaxID=50338 RepID=A0A2N0D3Q8_RHISU|nr:hypothetical protein [Rhizobium sullae]PKA40717.1 hypothetical protein CWR43_25690 [Rhizobium sullae]UWU13747.1 hypothetical protein N2599_16660 [Rhizobium sullae]